MASKQLAFTSEDFFYWRSLKVKFLFHAIVNEGCLGGIRPLENQHHSQNCECLCVYACKNHTKPLSGYLYVWKDTMCPSGN